MYIESITREDLEKLEYASFPGKIQVIDSVGAEFNRAIAYLRSQKIIGFDTETRPCFGPNQPRYGVSLLQLSGPGKAYLFRLKSMGMHRRLCRQKIGADYGIRDKSVKKMTAIILGFRISKTQQLSNWEAEELSESQCKYAATDAWVCREMYIKLMNSEKNPLPEQVNQ